MDQLSIVKLLAEALKKSKLARTAVSPKALGIGRGKGVLMVEGTDGIWYRVNVTVTTAEISEEE